jgi:hypothetical protein
LRVRANVLLVRERGGAEQSLTYLVVIDFSDRSAREYPLYLR